MEYGRVKILLFDVPSGEVLKVYRVILRTSWINFLCKEEKTNIQNFSEMLKNSNRTRRSIIFI